MSFSKRIGLIKESKEFKIKYPLPQIHNPYKKISVTLIQNIRDFFWMAKSPDFEY